MNAKVLGLVAGACLALAGCVPEVSKLSCGADAECAQGFYCDRDHGGARGVCVEVQASETNCADGNDNDRDGKTDCGDEDCRVGPCRPSAGPCDVAEVCGAGDACPVDQLVQEGAKLACREETACGAAAICDGQSAACPGSPIKDSKDKVCREETGCGKAATCDGVSPDCPAQEPKERDTVCGATINGPCGTGGKCDGVSLDCPPPSLLPKETLCPDRKPCEREYFCSGAEDGSCEPSPGVEAKGKVCRAAVSSCDVDEVCDGSSPLCPEDQVALITVACREATKVCELKTFCDGKTTVCPPTAYAGKEKECRAATLPCDVAESCDGTGPDCPRDLYVPKEQAKECNKSLGPCDPAETCDGISATCPKDVLRENGYQCKAATGVCELDGVCDGQNPGCPESFRVGEKCGTASSPCEEDPVCVDKVASCPAPLLKPFGTVCRKAASPECHFDAICNGTTNVCPPADPPKPVGTSCRAAPADPCTVAPSCDNSGTCNTTASYSSPTEQCGLTSIERCVSGANGGTVCSWPAPSIASPNGWQWENPLPQGNTLYGVSSNAAARYFVGEAGTALRYDGTFTRMTVIDGNNQDFTGALRGTCAHPLGKVWAVGDRGFIGKHNPADATSGFVQTFTGAPTVTFRAVWCEPGGKLVAVGDNGAVWRGDGVTMTAEPRAASVHLTAVSGASYDDLWAVGASGTVLHRDPTTSKWAAYSCPGGSDLVLTGVGVVKPILKDPVVWISGRTNNWQNPLPGVYQASVAQGCVPYQDPDGYSPGGLTALVVTGEAAGWAVNLEGEALELKAGKWSEPISVGLNRELFAVDSGVLGLAVAGMAGSISVHPLLGTRWLPSRSVTPMQLNAAWIGNVNAFEESVVVGKHGTLLRRALDGRWVVPVALSSAGANFHDDLNSIAGSGVDADLWIGGLDATTTGATGVLYDLHAIGLGTSYAAPASITGVALNKDTVTVAAKTPYQLDRLGGGASLVGKGSDLAGAVACGESGSRAFFASQKVYSLADAGATALPFTAFGTAGTYTALQAVDEPSGTGDEVTALYALAADLTSQPKVFKASYLANVDDPTAATPMDFPLDSAPMALRVTGPGKFWVVGADGLAKNVGATATDDAGGWAWTRWTLRGVAVSADGAALAVGDQGAILRRPKASVGGP
ncbi:MAG: hypothetical protein QM765_07295 [Myxococcales bacterium]